MPSKNEVQLLSGLLTFKMLIGMIFFYGGNVHDIEMKIAIERTLNNKTVKIYTATM